MIDVDVARNKSEVLVSAGGVIYKRHRRESGGVRTLNVQKNNGSKLFETLFFVSVEIWRFI